MSEENLVLLVRKEIKKLQEQDVPNLMRKKDVERLREIAENIDFSCLEKNHRPEFKLDRLFDVLAEEVNEDVLYATAFYVWANPYTEYGDIYFFDDSDEFFDLLSRYCGEWGKRICKIKYLGYVLSSRKINCWSSFTLEQLLGVKRVRGE